MAIVQVTPEDFFREAFAEAMDKERVTVGPFAQMYIVRLLVRQVDHGFHPSETLSDRLAAAHHATQTERMCILRDVGDKALVYSGLWWRYQYRPLRPSHAQLHVILGRQAYGMIGSVPFDELAECIEGVIAALMRLGTEYSLSTERDILNLYWLWEETRNRHAARALTERGLILSPYAPGTPS